MAGRDSASGGPASSRPRTRLDPEVRREQILDAAESVLAGRDPGDVTFEEIAEAAGVSRALVYNYFGDKGGVVAALYFRSFERLDGELLRTLDRAGTGAERIRAVVECYLGFAADHSAIWRLIGSAEAVGHPEVQRARRVRFDRMAAAWGGTAEARIVARAVVGLLEAATLDWLESPEVDLDRAAAVLHRMVYGALQAIDDHEGVAFPHVGHGGVVPREASVVR